MQDANWSPSRRKSKIMEQFFLCGTKHKRFLIELNEAICVMCHNLNRMLQRLPRVYSRALSHSWLSATLLLLKNHGHWGRALESVFNTAHSCIPQPSFRWVQNRWIWRDCCDKRGGELSGIRCRFLSRLVLSFSSHSGTSASRTAMSEPSAEESAQERKSCILEMTKSRNSGTCRPHNTSKHTISRPGALPRSRTREKTQ